MKNGILLICFFLAKVTLIAQANDFVSVLGTDLPVGSLQDYGLREDDKENKFTGSPLLWEDWTPGKFKLKGNKEYTEKDYEINYDSFNKLLYLKLGSAEYYVNVKMLDSVALETTNNMNRNYVSNMNSKGIYDLYEILSETETLSLLLKKDAEIEIQPYSPAFDIGSKKPKLILKESMYFSRDGKLYEVPKSRKKFIKMHENTAEIKDVVDYFKNEKVNFKKEKDIQSAMLEIK